MACQLKLGCSQSFSLELVCDDDNTSHVSHIPGDSEVNLLGSSSGCARGGTTASWHLFGQSKWKQIYPWILEKQDGIYCIYCSHSSRAVRSRSSVFITKPFTGNRPDKLGRRESYKAHMENQKAFQDHQVHVTSNSTVVDIIDRSTTLTVDEIAFCDAMRCMYFLNKKEIPHTTNFRNLKKTVSY